MRHGVHSQPAAACSAFPERTHVEWETTNLRVRNAAGFVEQQQLVYEVSWIEELCTWRRFLMSRGEMRSDRQEMPC